MIYFAVHAYSAGSEEKRACSQHIPWATGSGISVPAETGFFKENVHKITGSTIVFFVSFALKLIRKDSI